MYVNNLREEERGLHNSLADTAAPREEEKVPPLLSTKDLREEEEVFRIPIRCGDIQGGGEDAAASSQMTQGGREGHLIP